MTGLEILIGDIEAIAFRGQGLVDKLHSCFSWCAPSLVAVTRYTGTDHILPSMLPAAAAGDDMVEG
jgi:hypothetical protein